MILLPFRPLVSEAQIDCKKNYDYSPCVVAGRAWWTAGLGSDTIASTRLNGTAPLQPWLRPGKLVADPYAVRRGLGWRVFHTVGNPDGKNNGVGWVDVDNRGRFGAVGMLIPQSLVKGTYGYGQPSIAFLPNGAQILFMRADGPNGDTLRAFELDGTNLVRSLDFRPVDFVTPWFEDGASPCVFWHRSRLHLLVCGGGWAGIRTFQYDAKAGRLARDYSAERELRTPTGGTFRARTATMLFDPIDGAEVERDNQGRAIVGIDGTVRCWIGSGTPTDPGTWSLKSFRIPLPGR